MKIIYGTLSFALALCSLVFAQQDPDDPGIQDSIIIQIAEVYQPMWSVTVDVYFVTDDPVGYFLIPLKWHADSDSIYPQGTIIRAPWDEVYLQDSISLETRYMRIWGSSGLPPINTGGVRSAVFGIHFQITNFQPQVIPIDSTSDLQYGSILLRLEDGITEITPAFVPGAIIYDPYMTIDDGNGLPRSQTLLANYPNPFNAQTTIRYSLSQAGPVELSIYNLLGQKVATLVDGIEQAGEHKVVWDAGNVPSGVYFYKLASANFYDTRKLILLR